MLLLAAAAGGDASAQGRGQASRNAPPPSGHQTEAVDLNEGKSAPELFKAGCAVCHQSPAGLAKGRREGELLNFLRKHYTVGVEHAAALAGYLAASGGGRGGPATAATPRATPVDRPPAPIEGRRSPADDEVSPDPRRRPAEAARPAEREPASKRKPERPVAARHAPAPASTPAPASAPAQAAEAPASEVATPSPAPASAPPAEEKPAAPEIPL